MFGLLNPALTPIKTKIALIVAGAVVVLLLGALVTTKILWGSLQSAKVDIGRLSADFAAAVQTSNDNEAVWELERAGYVKAIRREQDLATIADRAAAKARENERKYDRALAIALNTLKETSHASPEVEAWSRTPVPDAIVDGMCAASAAATGEVEACGKAGDDAHRDPGEPARRLPDPSTT